MGYPSGGLEPRTSQPFFCFQIFQYSIPDTCGAITHTSNTAPSDFTLWCTSMWMAPHLHAPLGLISSCDVGRQITMINIIFKFFEEIFFILMVLKEKLFILIGVMVGWCLRWDIGWLRMMTMVEHRETVVNGGGASSNVMQALHGQFFVSLRINIRKQIIFYFKSLIRGSSAVHCWIMLPSIVNIIVMN